MAVELDILVGVYRFAVNVKAERSIRVLHDEDVQHGHTWAKITKLVI